MNSGSDHSLCLYPFPTFTCVERRLVKFIHVTLHGLGGSGGSVGGMDRVGQVGGMDRVGRMDRVGQAGQMISKRTDSATQRCLSES